MYQKTVVSFKDRGQGVPVLFVPGSFRKLAAWKPIYANHKKSYRMIETSLCGYGQTSEIRLTADLAMSHQFDVLANVTTRAATSLDNVGHSFGATIALILALENPKNILSLTLFELNPLCFCAKTDVLTRYPILIL